jgi:hypothetical protein
MKRNFAIVVALVVVALALSSRPVRAQNAALVITDAACGVYAGDCSTGVLVTGNFVVTHSGNQKVSCQGILPAGSPLPTTAAHCDITTSGFPCTTNSAVTANWHETVSPSGHFNLQCFAH